MQSPVQDDSADSSQITWPQGRRPAAVQCIQQAVRVAYHYPVYFTANLFAPENPLFADVVGAGGTAPVAVLFVVDRGVAACHADLVPATERYCGQYSETIRLAGPPLLVEGGEAAKNDASALTEVHAAIDRCGICRHSYLAVIGGGAVLDMVGYAAATAHRGVRLIRVPTTVLSQNDSGVGVKNGVNAFGKKNFLGAFAPPAAVLNDSAFLRTLSTRDWCGGIAEAIKVALLKDAAFFDWIEAQAPGLVRRELPPMENLIYHCARLHLEHIATSGDPFELGSSRPLDFGHWAAHKLEHLSGYRLRHGEAVAIGVALDATYSFLAGILPEEDWRRILAAIAACNLAVYTPELDRRLQDRAGYRVILTGLEEFRAHIGGRLTITLLEAIGRGVEVHTMDNTLIEASIDHLRDYQLRGKENRQWTDMLVRAR